MQTARDIEHGKILDQQQEKCGEMFQVSMLLQENNSHTFLAFEACAVQKEHSLFLPSQTEIYAKSEEELYKWRTTARKKWWIPKDFLQVKS